MRILSEHCARIKNMQSQEIVINQGFQYILLLPQYIENNSSSLSLTDTSLRPLQTSKMESFPTIEKFPS